MQLNLNILFGRQTDLCWFATSVLCMWVPGQLEMRNVTVSINNNNNWKQKIKKKFSELFTELLCWVLSSAGCITFQQFLKCKALLWLCKLLLVEPCILNYINLDMPKAKLIIMHQIFFFYILPILPRETLCMQNYIYMFLINIECLFLCWHLS